MMFAAGFVIGVIVAIFILICKGGNDESDF